MLLLQLLLVIFVIPLIQQLIFLPLILRSPQLELLLPPLLLLPIGPLLKLALQPISFLLLLSSWLLFSPIFLHSIQLVIDLFLLVIIFVILHALLIFYFIHLIIVKLQLIEHLLLFFFDAQRIHAQP
jgi:hypothetical protein